MYKDIINDTFNTILEKKELLIKSLSIYTLILVVFEYLNIGNLFIVDGQLYFQDPYIFYISVFITFIFSIMIAVSTHRILILGETSVPTWGNFKFSKPELSYLWSSIKIGLVIGLIAGVIFFISGFLGKAILFIGLAIIAIVASIIFARCSLVFPSQSIGKAMSLSDSWDLTREYKLLTFITVIIFPVVFNLLVGGVYTLIIKFLAGIIHPNLIILSPVLNVFIIVFVVSTLSSTYKYIMGIKEEPITNITPQEVMEEEHEIDNLPRDEEKYIPYEQSKKNTNKLEEILKYKQNGSYVINPEEENSSFIKITDKIIDEFFDYGYVNISENSENRFILKNPDFEDAFVSLSFDKKDYIVEISNFPRKK